MPSTTLSASMIALLALSAGARASVVIGGPPGGPVTLHNGRLDIDLDGDGSAELSIINQPAYINYPGPVMGSMIYVSQYLGAGTYEGTEPGSYAAPLTAGQTVGVPATGFSYGLPDLSFNAVIHELAASYPNGLGDPAWLDGLHHFIGVDVLSGTDHHYGWIEVSVQDSGAVTTSQPWYDITIYGWAYRTEANLPVTVPEAPAAGLMALLAVARRSRSCL